MLCAVTVSDDLYDNYALVIEFAVMGLVENLCL